MVRLKQRGWRYLPLRFAPIVGRRIIESQNHETVLLFFRMAETAPICCTECFIRHVHVNQDFDVLCTSNYIDAASDRRRAWNSNRAARDTNGRRCLMLLV